MSVTFFDGKGGNGKSVIRKKKLLTVLNGIKWYKEWIHVTNGDWFSDMVKRSDRRKKYNSNKYCLIPVHGSFLGLVQLR